MRHREKAPTTGWSVAVVVPARNEAASLATTIDAARRAVTVAHRRGRVAAASIVIVADRCDDATAQVARGSLGPTDRVIEVAKGCVGAARGDGADEAITALRAPLHRTWIANTDADTVVGPDWIVRQLDHADRGTACVAGVVRLAQVQPDLLTMFEHRYRRGVRTTWHDHVHGANLGVRADVLAEVGNWSALVTGEDHDLWNRIRDRAFQVLADPSLVVTTSARMAARAPEGFAADLRELDHRLIRCEPESDGDDPAPALTVA